MKQKLEVGLQAIDREGLSVLGWQTAGGHLPKHVLLNINNIIFPFLSPSDLLIELHQTIFDEFLAQDCENLHFVCLVEIIHKSL